MGMDARQFIQTHPADAAAVAHRAGTTLVYLRMIGWGHKRPSPKLARALEDALPTADRRRRWCCGTPTWALTTWPNMPSGSPARE